jgi:type II secretory pathway component PulK
MNQRGFALLAALWLTVAFAIVAAAALAVGRTGLATAQNRLALLRAGWAAEACHAILEAQYSEDPRVRALDSTDLGQGTWCTARLDEPAAKLNLNLASREQLSAVLGREDLADTIMARRQSSPIPDPAALADLPGFDSATVTRLMPLTTAVGDGRLDLNSAPRELLALVPSLGPEAIETILARRATGRPIESLEAFAAELSPEGRAPLAVAWSTLVQATALAPPLFEGVFTGRVQGLSTIETRRMLLIPVGPHLAIVRRVVE